MQFQTCIKLFEMWLEDVRLKVFSAFVNVMTLGCREATVVLNVA